MTFGVPANIVSDHGSLFTSKFWSTFCFYLGARRRLSTAFHPQTDGQTERQNQTLEHYLRVYCNFAQDDWARWLPLAQLVYNKSVNATTGMTPIQSLMAYDASLQTDVEADTPEGEAPTARE